MGVDVWEVIRLANRHPRVNILSPGPGVGGHCIAVDPWFLVSAAPEQTPLIRTAREVNDGKVAHVIDRAAALVGTGIRDRGGLSEHVLRQRQRDRPRAPRDRKSTRLNSSH